MRLSTHLAAGALWAALSFGIALAAPVAMITDLQGGALTAQQDGGRLALMAYVEPGTEIRIEANAKLTLTYFARALEETFSGPARILVQSDEVKVLQGMAGRSRKLDPEKGSAAKALEPAVRERMAVAAFVMRSAAIGLALIGPVDTKVSTALPEFSWAASTGAHQFKLALMNEQGRVLREVSVHGTTWKPQAREMLRFGRNYRWKVESADNAGQRESAQAHFSVVDEATAARIAKQKPGREASFSERLLYAVQLEAEGLKYEAAQQWRALAAERPQDAVLQNWAR